MTTLQKIQLRQSENRQKLNELLGIETRTEAQDAELATLTSAGQNIEVELRGALLAAENERATTEPAFDAEAREAAELRGRSQFHRYVGAALQGRDADGVEAEFAAASGCEGLVPLALFGATTEDRAAVEDRAVTPAPVDSDVPHTHAPIVPALFDRSVAQFLGIEMPTAATGIQSFPVLGTSLQGGMKAEDADAAEGAGAYTVTDADPRRLTGSFRIRKEDMAKLPSLEDSLRDNLSMVLSDELDKQLVNGDGSAPNINGVLQQLTNPAAPAANAETYARYQAALSSHLDGLFATMPGDIRALVGPHTLRHMLSVYRANEDATTAYDMATMKYGGVRATRRIADPASNIQQAIIRRANPAGDRVAVAPVWAGLELVRDIYSSAPKGQIVVTGTVLVGGVVLLRAGAFVQDSFRLA